MWFYGVVHTTRDAEGLRCRHLLLPGSRLGCWRGQIPHALIVDAAGLAMRNAGMETQGWSFVVAIYISATWQRISAPAAAGSRPNADALYGVNAAARVLFIFF